MKSWIWLALAIACIASGSKAADYNTLRNLTAPPASVVTPLPAGSKVRGVQFVTLALQPKSGEAWALTYNSVGSWRVPDNSPYSGLISWTSGRVQEKPEPYKLIFDEELQKAGFSSGAADSLFAEGDSGADLKVGALISDLEGRFCLDCPSTFNPHGIPATVMMTANWEIYSTLERRVVAKITTHGGADYIKPLTKSFAPPVQEGFRENVRQLLASAEFRKLVTTPVGSAGTAAGGLAATPIVLQAGKTRPSLSQATTAVAVVFAADGSGSGFLVSSEGYLVTNQHVVGATKYVKVKWSDGSETLGEVVRADSKRDVALVKADSHGRSPLELRTGPVEQGEPVYAIGSPLGEAQQNTMTKGIVSATRVRDGLSYIQSDVAVTHGNSGGPLLDEKGRVIGLTESGLAPDGSPIGINFFIPIGDALRALALTLPAATGAAKAEVAAAPVRSHTARKP